MLLAAMLASAVITLVPIQSADAGVRRQMIGTINFVRSWSHIHRLRMSRRLSRGARAWARHLMHRKLLAHSSRALRRREGEVIEWHSGGRAHVRNTVVEWLNSPSHRHVMLARRYRRAGAGRAVGRIGGRRATIWVVRFAR
jgi:uncharacterized protein YkwD